jgi:putative membrane protein
MWKALRFSLGAVIGALISFPLHAQQSQGPGYGPHMWNSGWHDGWFFGPFMMIVYIAVLVAVVVVLVRWLGGAGRGGAAHGGGAVHGTQHKAPLDILKERYAKGEIDKEEYEERRRVLGK